MKILVTGACGQLGTELRVRAAASEHSFTFTDVHPCEGVSALDITDADAVRDMARGVDVIVNCAAYTNVDRAEDEPQLAQLLNATAPGILAAEAARQGATLIHISTDYVFDGNASSPIAPDHPTAPVSVYGRTKLQGERAVLEAGCGSIIIRTAWLYSPYGRNFLRTMKALTAERDTLKVVSDQIGTPTYAGDLADGILHIINAGRLSATGIYHFSNEGEISWYDFAVEICRLSGNSCRIEPCSSGEFPSKVKRPHYSVLDKTSFRRTFGVEIPGWKESLQKVFLAAGDKL